MNCKQYQEYCERLHEEKAKRDYDRIKSSNGWSYTRSKGR